MTAGATRAGALLASALFASCTANPYPHTAPADPTMVRLDIVERALTIASADLDALTPKSALPATPSWSNARKAIDAANRALGCAREAVASWERGDARSVEPRMNALALRLSAVSEALGPAGVRPAAGLIDVVPAPSSDPTP